MQLLVITKIVTYVLGHPVYKSAVYKLEKKLMLNKMKETKTTTKEN